MVLVGVKKKVSKNIEFAINKKIVNKIYNVNWKKKYTYNKNPISDVLIHLYCKTKNIKSPLDNSNDNNLLNYLKPSIEEIKGKYIKLTSFSLRKDILFLKLLMKKYKLCVVKKCFLCNPFKKFIKNVVAAESLVSLN